MLTNNSYKLNVFLSYLAGLLLSCLTVFTSLPTQAYISTNIGEPHLKFGYVGSRNLVLGANKQPIFIEIDTYGSELQKYGERSGNLANAYTMSADTYRGYVDRYQTLKSTVLAENPLAIIDADGYTIYNELSSGARDILLAINNTGKGSKVYKQPAYGTQQTLLSATIDLTQIDGMITDPGSTVRALILSADGVVLERSDNNIAFKLAFFEEGEGDNRKLLGPLKGIGVSYANDDQSAGIVDEKGYYNFFHVMPPCPGFSYTMYGTVHTELYFTNFHPRNDQGMNTWSLNSSTTDTCFGYAQVSLGYNLSAQMADIELIGVAAGLPNGATSNDLIVDIIVVSGQGILSNAKVTEITPKIDLPASNLDIDVSESSITAYDYDATRLADTTSTDMALIGNNNLDLDGNGIEDTQILRSDGQIAVYLNRAAEKDANGQPINEDLLRQRDLNPDFSHQGLLKSLSLEDLKDTDIYVFRQSNNEMVSEHAGMSSTDDDDVLTEDPGLFEAGYTKEGIITFQMPVLLHATDKLPLNETVFGYPIPEPEGVYRDLLRPGETVRTVIINRATGYIGSQKGETKTDVSQSLNTQIDSVSLAPPNLKIRAVRTHKVSAGITQGDERTQLIGFEGSGLTTDTMVTITTEWYDTDGSPLPDNLPGYTARLAKVTNASGELAAVGSEFGGDAVAQFEIKPGTHTQTIHIPERNRPDHYYIHINGQPKERKADFKSLGNGPGPLGERPRAYVPFLVPIYDEDATLAQKLDATLNGDNPADVKPVYRWVYRPEMQFSVFDLDFRDIVISNATNNINDKSIIDLVNPVIGAESTIDMFFTLLESQFEALSSFGADRELILSVAGQEYVIQPKTDEQSFIDINTDYFNQLTAEDFLTISLYQNSDSANVLWEFAFSTLDVDVDSDNNNGLGLPDRSAEEEEIDADDTRVGKILRPNTGDEDEDGIPNFADFDPGIAFAPMVIEVPEDVDKAKASINLSYQASSPSNIEIVSNSGVDTYTPAPGYLRIWNKNGTELRESADLNNGGNYVMPGIAYPLNQLTIKNNQIIFYMEAIRTGDDPEGLTITAKLNRG